MAGYVRQSAAEIQDTLTIDAADLNNEFNALVSAFNNGSGINRVITAAQFIKGNMPYGTTYENPFLTDAEAYDVSGYINQQQRPKKPNLEKDFPDLLKKPVSAPYGPYVDNFSVEQHQKGPFQPIIAFYDKEYGIKKSK